MEGLKETVGVDWGNNCAEEYPLSFSSDLRVVADDFFTGLRLARDCSDEVRGFVDGIDARRSPALMLYRPTEQHADFLY